MLFHKPIWIQKQKKTMKVQLKGGHASRTYHFQTQFHGLTDMPAEF